MIKLSYCLSEKDRITFRTKKHSVTAIKTDKIQIEHEEVGSTTASFESFLKYAAFLLGVFILPIVLQAYVVIPAIKENSLRTIWYAFPVVFYFFAIIVYTIYWTIKAKKVGLQNHGAEHKVVLAYTKLERIPTIEEAMQFSRISDYCTCTIYSSFLTAHLIGFIIFLCTDFIVPEIVVFLVAALFSHFPPFYLLGKLVQRFTTAEPDKENVRLAIVALSELEQVEEQNS